MKEKMDSKNEKIKLLGTENFILVSIGLVALAWILDSLLDSLVFHENTVIGQIITPTNKEITIRLLFGSIFILFSVIIQFSVTRLKRAEDAQKEAVINLEGAVRKAEDEKNKTSAIIEAIGDGIILQDTDYKIVYQNQIQNEIYGNRVGEYCYKAYEGRDSICEDCPIEIAFKDGKIHKTERKVPTDKGILYIELTGSPLRDSTGKLIGGVKVVRDLTNHRRMEEELHRAHDGLELRVQERTSELAKANEALLESEANYRELTESIGEVFYALDRDLRYTYWNSASEALTGISAKDAVGKSLFELFPELKGSRAEKLYMEVLKTQQPRHFVHRYRTGDKDLFFEINAYPSKSGLSVIAKDITERRHAEEALEKERDKAQRYFDIAGTALVVIGTDQKVSLINKKGCNILGYKENEIVGKNWFDTFIPQRIRDDIKAVFNKLMAGEIEPVEFYENLVLTKSGEERLIAWHNSILKDETGRIIALLGSGEDITERKSTEEALKQSEEKYHKLIDNIQDGVFIIQDGKIQFANEAFARIAGYTVEEVTVKDYTELVAPEDLEMIADRSRRRKAGEDVPREYEFHMLHKDGRTRILVNMNVGLTNYSGRVASMGTVKDITEKKRLESQLLRAQRMESLGTLAGGIAHDINNVLTPIMLSQELLQEKLTDEESHGLLNTIKRSTHRGANLMKKVLSFTKGVEGERNPLQVANLISEVKQIAKETFPRNIEIRTDIPKDLWTISGDATQLHQVIMNLCVNARDAMLDGGILSISSENLLIDEDYARMNSDAKIGSYIVITVSDTGTGIPPKIIDRIFEPFFTTKEQGKGTGLGLSISLGIIRSHGGFINVYSEFGRGTAFKVYLPAITTNETLKAQKHQYKPPAGHGESILVVDDEDQLLEITKKTLEKHGYKVITANDGKEAIALYSQHKEDIKLVLMDMMMPVMDGSASIQEIRKINPKVKIIAVSGLAEKDKLTKVADLANAFLSKPYTTEKLLKTTHEVLNAK